VTFILCVFFSSTMSRLWLRSTLLLSITVHASSLVTSEVGNIKTEIHDYKYLYRTAIHMNTMTSENNSSSSSNKDTSPQVQSGAVGLDNIEEHKSSGMVENNADDTLHQILVNELNKSKSVARSEIADTAAAEAATRIAAKYAELINNGNKSSNILQRHRNHPPSSPSSSTSSSSEKISSDISTTNSGGNNSITCVDDPNDDAPCIKPSSVSTSGPTSGTSSSIPSITSSIPKDRTTVTTSTKFSAAAAKGSFIRTPGKNMGVKKYKRKRPALPLRRTAISTTPHPYPPPSAATAKKKQKILPTTDVHDNNENTDCRKMISSSSSSSSNSNNNIVGGDDNSDIVIGDEAAPTVVPARVVSSYMCGEASNSDSDIDRVVDSLSTPNRAESSSSEVIRRTSRSTDGQHINKSWSDNEEKASHQAKKITPPGLSSSVSASSSSSMAALVLAASTLSDCAVEENDATEDEDGNVEDMKKPFTYNQGKNRFIKYDGKKENSMNDDDRNGEVDMRRIASNQVVHCGAEIETEIISANKKSTTDYDNRGVMVHSKKYTFRDKLYDLMMDATSSGNIDIVSWSSDGKLFVVHDHARFASELLPTYFGHDKMRSLDRQLHYWSFEQVNSTKITNKSFGGKSWKHPFFQKGRRDLLKHIERKKKGNSKKDIKKNEKMKKDEIARNIAILESIIEGKDHSRGEIVSETNRSDSNSSSSTSPPRELVNDEVAESCSIDDDGDIII
jgi:hypothetical protein